MATVYLVCQGNCNPLRQDIDRAVQQARALVSENDDRKRMVALPDHLRVALRALKHTPHVHVGLTQFACATCGTARRYGLEG